MEKSIEVHSLGTQLSEIVESAFFVFPEICLLAFLLLILIFDLIFRQKLLWLFTITALLGLFLTTGLLLQQWSLTAESSEGLSLFSRMIQLDRLAIYFKILICVSAVFTVLISVNYKSRAGSFHLRSVKRIGEYYTVLFGLLLGAMLLSMSTHLLIIYLAIELISISSYILTNFNFDERSTEASIKYILYGGVSSGVMLYGMSLLYGLTGTLDMTHPSFQENIAAAPMILVLFAGLFTLGGFLFKISSAPFHLWAPDVYEGAPTPVVALFSVVPKAAGFVVLMRYTAHFFSQVSFDFPWQTLLAVIAIITLLLGNFAALWQKNVKRMMAYSSIAHSGFILIGVLSTSSFGMLSVLFYVSVYALMNLAAFLIIIMISRETGSEEISQYRGLGEQYPLIGVLMLIAMISLTGLPPTAGFTAKLFIFSSLWEAYQSSDNLMLLLLLVFGLFNTVVSLFYYLKIPYFMFFKKSETTFVADRFSHQRTGRRHDKFYLFDKILAIVLIFPLLILFFKSNWLIDFIHTIPFEF